MPTITSIKQQKHNRSRLSIFIDGEYELSTTMDIVLKHRLKSGDSIEIDTIDKIKLDTIKQDILNKTLNFLSFRPRSEYEVKTRIHRYIKDANQNLEKLKDEITDFVISKLNSLNLINDMDFAIWFIEQRINNRPRSKLEIIKELRTKHIDMKHISKAIDLTDFNEINSIKKILAKKSKFGIHNSNTKDKINKIIRYLRRRGFSYQNIMQVINE